MNGPTVVYVLTVYDYGGMDSYIVGIFSTLEIVEAYKTAYWSEWMSGISVYTLDKRVPTCD